ncbi:MAG: GNAT family N-acetyltransferase [Opitutales bacterium]|nr:GNAT family N-acetyltransferase [Opitutales bacterium]
MDERIRCFTAETAVEEAAVYFPFTQGGLCAQLPNAAIDFLKKFEHPIQHFLLRVARPEDDPKLAALLRAYGTNPQNYADLEQFHEENLPTIIHNLATCLQHRYFITLLLFEHLHPIAFFQVDPYDLSTVVQRFQKKWFPFWSQFFQKSLQWEALCALSFKDRQQWFSSVFSPLIWENFCRSCEMDASWRKWLAFLNGSIQTTIDLQKQWETGYWIGNLSYHLLPKYQGKGWMSQTLQAIEPMLAALGCSLLFSDRVAKGNQASIRFLQRNHFIQGGNFLSYYGPLYRTRRHPMGNFSETCACFYKKLKDTAVSIA